MVAGQSLTLKQERALGFLIKYGLDELVSSQTKKIINLSKGITYHKGNLQKTYKLEEKRKFELINSNKAIKISPIRTLARNKLVEHNIGLVTAMMMRYNSAGNLDDFLSEGGTTLINAAGKFNYELGYRFSTYACRAILRTFSGVIKKRAKIYDKEKNSPEGIDIESYENLKIKDKKPIIEKLELEEVINNIKNQINSLLNHSEKEVINARFLIDSPLTLQQTGEKTGYTKERIRQIQNKALEKILDSFSDEEKEEIRSLL